MDINRAAVEKIRTSAQKRAQNGSLSHDDVLNAKAIAESSDEILNDAFYARWQESKCDPEEFDESCALAFFDLIDRMSSSWN